MSQQRIILLATAQPERFTEFSAQLRADAGVRLLLAESADKALDAAVRQTPALVIVDQTIGDVPGLTLVRRLMEVNAFIYTAVVSDLAEEAFHEQSEGLGILSHLPVQPGAADAGALLALLRKMMPTA